MLQFGASLTDDTSSIIYDRNMLMIQARNFVLLTELYPTGFLTEGGDLNSCNQLLVIGVDAFAGVGAGVLLPQVFDEEHDGSVTRLLLRVNPAQSKCKILAISKY
jgi:hypothetical protein